ncbi:MAG TPA: transcriptional repressor, partial [Arthrobacter sp.]|nr:transcriptional repressor [Arthrobacter sp.]
NAKPMTIQIADVMYQGICQDCQQSQKLSPQTSQVIEK